MGRVGLAMSKADPEPGLGTDRLGDQQGLYRSDDLGKTWRFVSDNANIIARPFYFYHVYANPSDADDVWVTGNKVWHSTDGGETWVLEPGVKDDFQDIWIDPNDPDRMIIDLRRRHAGHADRRARPGPPSRIRAECSSIVWIPTTQFPYNVYTNAQDC